MTAKISRTAMKQKCHRFAFGHGKKNIGINKFCSEQDCVKHVFAKTIQKKFLAKS